MNQLFSIGKQFFNKKSNDDDSETPGSSKNPLSLIKQLDKNGDGKITEEGFVDFFQYSAL